jgi:hypothetical protein
MKKILILMLAVLSAGMVFGQESKKQVAVYTVDVSGQNIMEFIGDYVTNAIVKQGKYKAVERTAQFLEALGKEHGFQHSGAVDDKQISKIGKNLGAHYVCVVKVAVTGTRNDHFISSRLIDVETTELTASSHPIRINVNDWGVIEKSCDYLVASLFSKRGGNKQSYLWWGIIDVSYPFNLGTSFIGKFGWLGFQVGIGCDFGGKATYENSKGDEQYIHSFSYNAGLRLYPYKNLYLLTGYGTLGCQKISPFNDSEGRFGTEGWRQGKGLSVMAGYEMPRGGISISAGMAYDLFLTNWYPRINLKIGYAWSISK